MQGLVGREYMFLRNKAPIKGFMSLFQSSCGVCGVVRKMNQSEVEIAV